MGKDWGWGRCGQMEERSVRAGGGTLGRECARRARGCGEEANCFLFFFFNFEKEKKNFQILSFCLSSVSAFFQF